MASSSDRETFVYLAKLAEQAERYDGKSLTLAQFFGEIELVLANNLFEIRTDD